MRATAGGFENIRHRIRRAHVHRDVGAGAAGQSELVRRKGRRGDNVFRETAIAAIAGVVLVLADGFPASLAIFAAHAGVVQPRHTDSVALPEIGNVGPERGHDASGLMTRNERNRGFYRPVALGGMKIRMAHAAGHHLDQ